jgi:hypothetical protein
MAKSRTTGATKKGIKAEKTKAKTVKPATSGKVKAAASSEDAKDDSNIVSSKIVTIEHCKS